MPDPTTTGYILVAITVNDDDTPKRDPEIVLEELLPQLRPLDIVEASLVFAQGDGTYRPYGSTYIT